MPNIYIDVRDSWPVLVMDHITIELEGLSREVTVEQAMILIKMREEEQDETN